MSEIMEVGDMIFNKWVLTASGGIWYKMELMDKADPTTKCLFPNILMGKPVKSLTRWGMASMK